MIKDKSTCQMSFNTSDCVWSDSSSICLGPERCIKPQITGKEICFPLAECNEKKWKMFSSHTTWGLCIGHVTKRGTVAIVASAITDLPTHPPLDFSFVGCFKNVMCNFVILLVSPLSRVMLCVHLLIILNKGQAVVVGLA